MSRLGNVNGNALRVALCAVDLMTVEWHDHLPSLDSGVRRKAKAARELLAATLKSRNVSCAGDRPLVKISTMDDETYRFPKYSDNLAWPNRTACGRLGGSVWKFDRDIRCGRSAWKATWQVGLECRQGSLVPNHKGKQAC